jgi:hypothetical protein
MCSRGDYDRRQAGQVGAGPRPHGRPRCVYRRVATRVWDASGSPYGHGEQRLHEAYGGSSNVTLHVNPIMIPCGNPQWEPLYVQMIYPAVHSV